MYLWQLYTDKDVEQESRLEKYTDSSTTGFQKMMYTNEKSVGNLLSKLKPTFDQMHCLVYIQKNNCWPNEPLDK